MKQQDTTEPGSAPSRRQFLRRGGLLTLGGAGVPLLSFAGSACAPAPAPAAAPQVTAPAAAKQAWEDEWDRTLAAARREGKVTVLTITGIGFRKGLDAFQEAFPGIAVEHSAIASASIYAPKVMQEQQAGIYGWDIAVTGAASNVKILYPAGAWDPIRPLLFRPDVISDDNWHGGFPVGFVDNNKQLGFTFSFDLRRAFAVNTDLVKDGEIKNLQDLLNPRWKGKMVLADVRTGFMFRPADEIRRKLGEGPLKQLLVDQEPTYTRDLRQLADGLIRGKYPIAGGLTPPDLQEFRDQGLATNIRYLDIPEADYLVSTTAFHFKRAPHPNAAKILANWLLTKEAQTIWSKALNQNSRRKDVPIVQPLTAPRPGMQFVNPETEETLPQIDQTQVIINKMVGISN